MADEIRLQVTQPYHGAGGELLYEPGQLLEAGADFPEDLRYTKVIVESEDKSPAKAEGKAPPGKPGTSSKSP
jgi:hypothetical protein